MKWSRKNQGETDLRKSQAEFRSCLEDQLIVAIKVLNDSRPVSAPVPVPHGLIEEYKREVQG